MIIAKPVSETVKHTCHVSKNSIRILKGTGMAGARGPMSRSSSSLSEFINNSSDSE